MKSINTLIILLLVIAGSLFSQSWRQFDGGANKVAVYALGMYNGDLIAGGFFDTVSNVPARSIARWDGSLWHPLGIGMSGTFYGNGIRCLFEYRGKLIAGGYFDTAGTVLSRGVACWDGTSWTQMGGGVNGADPHVEALFMYKGLLYVGGTFLSAGQDTTPGISCWTGNAWKPVGSSIIPPENGAFFGVYAMAEFQRFLYIGGTYHHGPGQDSAIIAMWNGSTWLPVDGGVHGTIVKALTVYNGKLIVGGDFTRAGSNLPVNNIAAWDGTGWSEVNGGCDGTVYTFCTISNKLYTSGTFYHSGSVLTNMIACWNGTDWYPLSSGMDLGVLALINYPPSPISANIVAGGFFNSAGGVVAKHIAFWGEIVGFGNLNNNVPDNFSLKQNYPNPFNPETKIAFEIPKSSFVKIEVFDLLGRKVAEPIVKQMNAGKYEISFNGDALSSGTYFYKLSATSADGEFTDTKKMILMK